MLSLFTGWDGSGKFLLMAIAYGQFINWHRPYRKWLLWASVVRSVPNIWKIGFHPLFNFCLSRWQPQPKVGCKATSRQTLYPEWSESGVLQTPIRVTDEWISNKLEIGNFKRWLWFREQKFSGNSKICGLQNVWGQNTKSFDWCLARRQKWHWALHR